MSHVCKSYDNPSSGGGGGGGYKTSHKVTQGALWIDLSSTSGIGIKTTKSITRSTVSLRVVWKFIREMWVSFIPAEPKFKGPSTDSEAKVVVECISTRLSRPVIWRCECIDFLYIIRSSLTSHQQAYESRPTKRMQWYLAVFIFYLVVSILTIRVRLVMDRSP